MQDFLDELDKELWEDNSHLSNTQETNTQEINTKEINTKEVKTWELKTKEVKKITTSRNIRVNKDNRRNKDSRTNKQGEVRWKFISKFPDVKFYLPTLREGYTRYMPIW